MQYLINKIKTTLEQSLDKKDIQYVVIGGLDQISKAMLDKGVVVLLPISTEVSSITTGIRDMERKVVKFVIGKNIQNQFNKNAQRESGQEYLMRVMEGNNADNTLITTSLRYIIRQNFRVWGVQQDSLSIDYMTDELQDVAEGAITGSMQFTVIDSVIQPIIG